MAAVLVLATGPAYAAQPDAAPSSPAKAKSADVSKVLGNGLMLVPGRTLAVRWRRGKALVAVSEGAAPQIPFSAVPATADKETWSKVLLERAPVSDGLLVFTMWQDLDRGTILLVENGAGASIGYIAHMILPVGDKFRLSPTTTCAVKSKGATVEHWADQMSALAVGLVVEMAADLCMDGGAMRAYKAGEQPPSAKQ